MFADDADMIAQGIEAETKMKKTFKMCNDLCSATGGKVEQNECKLFAWKHAWKQGKK